MDDPSADGDGGGGGFDAVRLSKLLAFVLRHRPDVLGLVLDAAGWVDVGDLVERLNARRRLPFAVERAHLDELLVGEGRRRFELKDGRLRARGGHTVAGVKAKADRDPLARRIPASGRYPRADAGGGGGGHGGEDEEAHDEGLGLPEFLFVGVDAESLGKAHGLGALQAPTGQPWRLFDDEAAALEAAPDADIDVVVVDAARASRQGAVFAIAADGVHTAESIPLRYLLSLREDFERQISAGGVLVKGRGEDTHFALIRTLPREQAADPPDISDARSGDRRREDAPERRSGAQGVPPDGVERRGTDRRQGRRRRSARWGIEGRLELPKGKLEAGETPEQAAVREVREELGIGLPLAVGVEGMLATNHYVFRTPEQRMIFKTVHYFLLRCDGEPSFAPRREEGIVSVEWWPGTRAINQVAFRNLRPVLERAWQLSQLR